jgi:hypothetical protein
MKKSMYLFLSIFMAVCSIAALFLGFAILEPTGNNLIIISCVFAMGMMGSIVYYESYKNRRDGLQ